MLYTSCPGFSRFTKDSWFLLLGNDIRKQDTDATRESLFLDLLSWGHISLYTN